jgi:GGDEF domain-containing protein
MASGSTLTYQRARSLLLLAGFTLIAAVALVALVRGVDRVEVIGTLLFIPVFAGFMLFSLPGAVGVSLAAAAIYLLLRLPAIELVGFGPLAGQVTARLIGYLLFGLGGGWAIRQIKGTLDKMELYDDIDDETGLGNARSFLETADVERARAERYQKVFSVAAADFSAWEDLPSRKTRNALRELGTRLAAGVRSSDHPVHGRIGNRHVIGVVLPETSSEGARIVADNLKSQLATATGVDVRVITATHPGNEAAMARIIELFKEIDRTLRPPTPEADHQPAGR